MVVIHVGSDDSNTDSESISSITWGGQALTRQLFDSYNGNRAHHEMWTMDEATIIAAGDGTNDFIIAWSGSPSDETVSVVTIQNVDQTTPLETLMPI